MTNTDVIKTLIQTLDSYELSLLNTILIGETQDKEDIETSKGSHTFEAVYHLTWDISDDTRKSLIVFMTDLLYKKLSHNVLKQCVEQKIDHSFMGYT